MKQHFKKDDPGYIEFNEFITERDANPLNVKPGEMKWSVSELLKLVDEDGEGQEMLAKRKA